MIFTFLCIVFSALWFSTRKRSNRSRLYSSPMPSTPTTLSSSLQLQLLKLVTGFSAKHPQYIYICVDTRIYLYIYKFGVVGIFSVVVVAVFDFFRSRPAWEMFATRLQSNGKSGFSFELKKKTKTKTTMYEIRKFACLRSFGRSSVRLFVSLGLRFSRSLAQPSDKFLLQQSY